MVLWIKRIGFMTENESMRRAEEWKNHEKYTNGMKKTEKEQEEHKLIKRRKGKVNIDWNQIKLCKELMFYGIYGRNNCFTEEICNGNGERIGLQKE